MTLSSPQQTGCESALDLPPPVCPRKRLVLVSAAALVDPDGRVLLTCRPPGKPMAGLWEFLGGKMEAGESPEYALMRELSEELGIETRPCCFAPGGVASYAYDDFHLLMPLFICRVWRGDPAPREGQSLRWVFPRDMYDLPMPPADIPLVTQLEQML